MRKRTTSNSLMVPSPSVPINAQAGPPRSASPSGLGNKFSKWFSRSPTAQRVQTADMPRSSTSSGSRKPTISQPSDPRPLGNLPGAPPGAGLYMNGPPPPGGGGFYMNGMSQSVLDLSTMRPSHHPNSHPFPQADTSLGDLRSLSNKKWSHSVDDLHRYPSSAPTNPPTLPPLNTNTPGADLATRIDQYRNSPGTPTGPTFSPPSPVRSQTLSHPYPNSSLGSVMTMSSPMSLNTPHSPSAPSLSPQKMRHPQHGGSYGGSMSPLSQVSIVPQKPAPPPRSNSTPNSVPTSSTSSPGESHPFPSPGTPPDAGIVPGLKFTGSPASSMSLMPPSRSHSKSLSLSKQRSMGAIPPSSSGANATSMSAPRARFMRQNSMGGSSVTSLSGISDSGSERGRLDSLKPQRDRVDSQTSHQSSNISGGAIAAARKSQYVGSSDRGVGFSGRPGFPFQFGGGAPPQLSIPSQPTLAKPLLTKPSPAATTPPAIIEPVPDPDDGVPDLGKDRRASQILWHSGLVNRLVKENHKQSGMWGNYAPNDDGWKPFKAVLKGSKLYFYKPPGDRNAAIHNLFPTDGQQAEAAGLMTVEEAASTDDVFAKGTVAVEGGSGRGRERDDGRRKRAYWGRGPHPGLVKSDNGPVRGTFEGLVHEAVFGSTFSLDAADATNREGAWRDFSSSVVLCLPRLVGREKFELEFCRCATYLVSGAQDGVQDVARERVAWLSKEYIHSHGPPENQKLWDDLRESTISDLPDFTTEESASTGVASSSELVTTTASNTGISTPRSVEPHRGTSISKTPPRRSSLNEARGLNPRIWAALQQEGLTREIFVRLDPHLVARSLTTLHRTAFEGIPDSAVTLSALLDEGDPTAGSSGRLNLNPFIGSELQPHWLTSFVVSHILGPGDTFSSAILPGTPGGHAKKSSTSTSKTHTRSEMITAWARVGEVCRLAGNEAAWRAIAAGLTSRPIARLEKAWKRVDQNALNAVESWVYTTEGSEQATSQQRIIVPWLGDAQESIGATLARCHSYDKEDEWIVEPMKKSRQTFDEARTKFLSCPRLIDSGPTSYEAEVLKLLEFWKRVSGGPDGPRYLSMDKYLKLSLAAEPRRKGEFEPHFWVRPSALQTFSLVPLQFHEPLPSLSFIEQHELLERYVNHEPGSVPVSVPNLEALGMTSVGKRKRTGRETSLDLRSAGLGSADLGGTMISLFDGELLLQVLSSTEFIPSRPTSFADNSDEGGRTIGRAPSIRVSSGSGSSGPERKTSLARRSSLPPLTTRENLVVPENSVDPPLRVVVRAGTIDRLVDVLVFDLKGVTVSVADDNGEVPLNERRTREVKVNRTEFSNAWWQTFRSLLSPLVFFELLRKRYLEPSDGPFRAARRRIDILRTIQDWLVVGGGAQDILDDPELYKSIQALLHQPVDLDPNASATQETQEAIVALDSAHEALRTLFTQYTQRPRATVSISNETARPARRNFGAEPVDIDHCSPEELVDNLDALARVIFYNVTEEDLYVTLDLLEVQTFDRLGWFSSREPPSGLDEMDLQTIHGLLMEVHPSEHISELGQDNLYRLLPPGIRSAFRAHAIVTQWLVMKVAAIGIGLQRRQARMELVLRAIEAARRRSAGVRSTDIIPVDQPRVRSFVESALVNAIMSSESRAYQRAWQNVALARGTSCDGLHSLFLNIPGSSATTWASLTVDMGWFLERVLEILSIPNIVDPTTEEGRPLVNFDKRRQLHYLISHLTSFAAPRPSRRDTERYDFERLNAMDKEAQATPFDPRQTREDAAREAAQTPVPSSKKLGRPFQRDILVQQDKYKRDRYLRDRLGKELRQEQQRIMKRDDGIQKAMQARRSPAAARSARPNRNTKVISTLFHALRQSVALGADTSFIDDRRTAAELDFSPAGKPSMVLNLGDARATNYAHADRPFTFQLDTDEGAHYILQVLSNKDMSKWVETIGRVSKQAAQRRSKYLGPKPQVSDHLSARPVTATHDPTAVFGVDLEFLLLRESNGDEVPSGTIPSVMERCLNVIETRGLTEVGIYRIAGATTEINALKDSFNNGDDPFTEMTDIYAICDLVKTWFRILPRPVFPTSSYYEIITAVQNPDLEARLSSIRNIVHQLPRANFDLLKRISEHLDKITDFEESNQMTSEALAIVFSPNLLRAPDQNFLLVMQNMGHTHNVVKTLIGHFHMIFDEDVEDDESTEEGEGGEEFHDIAEVAEEEEGEEGNSSGAGDETFLAPPAFDHAPLLTSESSEMSFLTADCAVSSSSSSRSPSRARSPSPSPALSHSHSYSHSSSPTHSPSQAQGRHGLELLPPLEPSKSLLA